MRGYLSFILVLASIALVLSLLELSLASRHTDLSKAVLLERAYALQMNVKEAAIESGIQGAAAGFAAYDRDHEVGNCKYCPDFFCSPPANPPPSNPCDAALCSRCFRESEARAAAEAGVVSGIAALSNHSFDELFAVALSSPKLQASTEANPLSKNGFSLDSIRFNEPLAITVSSTDISAQARLPKGYSREVG